MSSDVDNAYSKYLSGKRLRASSETSRSILTESESDRGRVIFSPAFRRLQQKAQVFSMEPNAAVRSRLTHSLEVSQIGRYIADEIGQQLRSLGYIDQLQQGALVNFVETACLMHDIGNPPFGHFGEAAIQQWFRNNGKPALQRALRDERGERISGSSIDVALADFLQFDGNPQGFRIVTRLQWNNDKYGLNLTATSLATFLKYLRSSSQETGKRFTKKPGFFLTEESIVRDVWSHFLIDFREPRRFPLNYVMEAADDIAYCISDLEDSFEKEIIEARLTFPEIRADYDRYGFDKNNSEHRAISDALRNIERGERDDGSPYTYIDFRTNLNRTIVRYVARRYVAEHLKILSGELDSLLPQEDPPGAILDVLKNYCRKCVYSHESVQRVELAGYTAISGLLHHFGPLLQLPAPAFEAALAGKHRGPLDENLLLEPKLLSLFPAKHINVYLDEKDKKVGTLSLELSEWVRRAHLVVDFVSGMTDDFSMHTYRTLAGMRL